MSVYRVIDVIGTSTQSWEDAAVTAVSTARKSLRDLRVAEVVQQDLVSRTARSSSGPSCGCPSSTRTRPSQPVGRPASRARPARPGDRTGPRRAIFEGRRLHLSLVECSHRDPAGPVLRAPKTAELIASYIRGQIVRGDLKTGDSLPSETVLMEMFGVSPPTLREAFRILEAESLISVRRGARGGARVVSRTSPSRPGTSACCSR